MNMVSPKKEHLENYLSAIMDYLQSVRSEPMCEQPSQKGIEAVHTIRESLDQLKELTK